MNKVCTIILNWNGLEDTLNCINSVLKSSYSNNTVVVVDNGSIECADAIVDRYPQVVLVKNTENIGYSGGNNTGFDKAADLGADYVWVLNNDTIVERDCLDVLVTALDDSPEVSAVSNLILYLDNSEDDVCWYAGGIIDGGLSRHHAQGESVRNISSLDYIDFVSGCSFLARLNVIVDLEGFDEDYFCYCEDVDLSLRITSVGGRLGYKHNAVVYHKVSASSGELSTTKIYYKHRNMLLFLSKHNFPLAPKVKWYVKSLRFVVSLTLKHHKPSLSMTLLSALWDGTNGKSGKR